MVSPHVLEEVQHFPPTFVNNGSEIHSLHEVEPSAAQEPADVQFAPCEC
ncbi:MAG: hypothetical protein SO287_00985 [Parabacteroides sp.]|nr:hypothetical protein [Parabacteroides sp.]MDD7062901.1 hypothetical protein [bacterium]MDY4756170.1 hypothetical protein [Parabacteroides sp.]